MISGCTSTIGRQTPCRGACLRRGEPLPDDPMERVFNTMHAIATEAADLMDLARSGAGHGDLRDAHDRLFAAVEHYRDTVRLLMPEFLTEQPDGE